MRAEQEETGAAERWATACHEAGHAVAALILGFPFERVTVAAAGDSAGRVEGIRFPDPEADADRAENFLVYLWAGTAATRELLRAAPASGGTDDRYRMEQYAGHAFPRPAEYGARLRAARARARDLVRRRRSAVEALAVALQVRGELTMAEAGVVLKGVTEDG